MPATVSGNPRNFKPDFDIGFRFDDADFLVLTTDEQNAVLDESAVRIAQYFKFFDPEDVGEPDAPTIWLPDIKELAINTSIEYNRNYGGPDPYFTILVRFVDDPTQSTGMPRGQVKARIETMMDDIVTEIDLIETEENLPIDALINWL